METDRGRGRGVPDCPRGRHQELPPLFPQVLGAHPLLPLTPPAAISHLLTATGQLTVGCRDLTAHSIPSGPVPSAPDITERSSVRTQRVAVGGGAGDGGGVKGGAGVGERSKEVLGWEEGLERGCTRGVGLGVRGGAGVGGAGLEEGLGCRRGWSGGRGCGRGWGRDRKGLEGGGVREGGCRVGGGKGGGWGDEMGWIWTGSGEEKFQDEG